MTTGSLNKFNATILPTYFYCHAIDAKCRRILFKRRW